MTYDDGTWFLTAFTPEGVHVHALPQEELREQSARLIAQRQALAKATVDTRVKAEQARTALADATATVVSGMRNRLSFPADHNEREEWHSQISPGVPHQKLLDKIPTGADGLPVCGECYRPPSREGN